MFYWANREGGGGGGGGAGGGGGGGGGGGQGAEEQILNVSQANICGAAGNRWESKKNCSHASIR
jgi:hypothetical protein